MHLLNCVLRAWGYAGVCVGIGETLGETDKESEGRVADRHASFPSFSSSLHRPRPKRKLRNEWSNEGERTSHNLSIQIVVTHILNPLALMEP